MIRIKNTIIYPSKVVAFGLNEHTIEVLCDNGGNIFTDCGNVIGAELAFDKLQEAVIGLLKANQYN